MTEEHKYQIVYHVFRPTEPLKQEDVPDDHGAADALLLTSILFNKEGTMGQSYVTIGLDGRRAQPDSTPEDLPVAEVFKCWTMLAAQLAEQLTPGWQRDVCHTAFEAVRQRIAPKEPA